MTAYRSEYMEPCGHGLADGSRCGAQPTRLFQQGRRCQRHTPSAVLGLPEPDAHLRAGKRREEVAR